MPYLIAPIDTPLYWVESADLAAYLAAGYTQATAAQIAAYNARDPYAGLQQAPPAPKVATGKPANPNDLRHVR